MKNNKKTKSSTKSGAANSNKNPENSCSSDSPSCRKMMLGVFAVIIIAISAYVIFYQTTEANIYAANKMNYRPLSMSMEDAANLDKIDSASKMEGSEENNLLIADKEGSQIFAKKGLNYVVGGDGADEFYYSLCSTNIIDDQVNVVEGFDPSKDKLVLFCAHHNISPKDIQIIHSRVDGEDVTFVEIQGKHKITAIALLGNIDLKVSDIVLNKRWEN